MTIDIFRSELSFNHIVEAQKPQTNSLHDFVSELVTRQLRGEFTPQEITVNGEYAVVHDSD
jgi:hypothetical protein